MRSLASSGKGNDANGSIVRLRTGQQGLLGLAFHPKFAEYGKIYVDYNNVYANGEITIERSESGNRTGSVWKLVSANQVPEGATTVPLGEPQQGAVEVDEEGEPITDGDAEEAEASAEATPAAQTSSDTGNAASAEEIIIDLCDFSFEPEHFIIPADTDVRVVLENHGQAPHNFTVNKRNNFSTDVEPGGIAETIINLPHGEYRCVCNVPGHKELNMNGVLVAK